MYHGMCSSVTCRLTWVKFALHTGHFLPFLLKVEKLYVMKQHVSLIIWLKMAFFEITHF